MTKEKIEELRNSKNQFSVTTVDVYKHEGYDEIIAISNSSKGWLRIGHHTFNTVTNKSNDDYVGITVKYESLDTLIEMLNNINSGNDYLEFHKFFNKTE